MDAREQGREGSWARAGSDDELTMVRQALLGRERELSLALSAREDLMAAISHEMRTPLTIVVGLGEVLARQADHLDPGSLRKFADRIAHHAGRLETMVQDLIDASQRDALRPTFRHVVIGEVIELARRDLELDDVTVSGPTDAAVHVDGQHVVRVLAHLLANATAYGRPPVTVTVGRDGDRVTLTVRDDGDGIPQHLRADLFEPFTQRDAGDRRTARGVGIGLHVARALARANGGELELVHDEGRPGATFRLSLRADDADQTDRPARWPQDEEAFLLFGVLSEPVVVHDGRRVLYANDGFLELVGMSSPAELVGRPAHELVRDPLAIADALERLASAGPDEPPPSIRIPLRHIEGHAVWVLATRRTARVGASDHVVVHVRPTKPPATTDALVAAMADEYADPRDHLRALLAIARDLLDADVGVVGQVDGDTCTVELVQPTVPHLPDGSSWPLQATLCLPGEGDQQVDALVVTDVARSRWAGHPAHRVLGAGAFAAAPVLLGGRPWGTLLLARTSPAHTWADDAADVVQLLASWYGSQLDRPGDVTEGHPVAG